MNKIDTYIQVDKYNWLAERNGIAIARVGSNNEFLLNSHAMILFGVSKNIVDFEDLRAIVSNINEFRSYVEEFDENTQQIIICLDKGGVIKNYLVSGIKIDKSIDLTIQPIGAGQNNAEYLCQYAIHSKDTFALWDVNKQLIYVNPNFEELFGRGKEELNNNIYTLYDWMVLEDRNRLEYYYEKKGLNSDFIDVEFRIMLPNKEIKWIWYQKKTLYDGNGNAFRHLGVLSDITKRKEVEQQLLFSKISIDQSLTPTFWITEESDLKYVNQAACDMLGYTFEELISKKIVEIDERGNEWQKLWETLKEEKALTLESTQFRKNGDRIPVEIKASFLDIDDEQYIFAFASDISDRKKIETRIKYLQDFEHLLFDISKRFITIPYDEIDSSIEGALKEICTFVKVDSAHIYLYGTDSELINLTHYYSASNKKINQEKYRKLPLYRDSWHIQKLAAEKYAKVPKVSELPKGDPIKKYCKKVDIGSLIDFALFKQDRLSGYFGITCKEEGREFDNEEMQFFQVIADIFISALQRRDFMGEILDSEQNYREIYNAANDAIFIHNAKTGKIEDVNKAMLNMYEVSYEQALRSGLSDLSSEEGEHTEKNALVKIEKAHKEPQLFEWQSKKSSGELFWTEVGLKKAEIHGELKVIAVVRDISERKKAQKLLEENELKFRTIVEGQSELIVKLDTAKKIVFSSPSFDKVFSSINPNILGTDFLEYIHSEDRELVEIAMDKLDQAPYNCYFEIKAQTKEGVRSYAWNFTAILQEEEVVNYIGVARDITYQQLVESALRESEERFRSIVQNLSDVVFLLDDKAMIKYVTPSCEQYLGLPPEELLGANMLNLTHLDDRWLAEENIALHIDGTDYSLPYEMRFKHANKSWKVFEAKSHNLLKHPAVNSIIFTISDITERKLVETQVLNAIIKTEEKERERFAKDLHDDLGPLLSSIKMYVGMLKKVDKVEKQEYIVENLQEIVKEAIVTTKDVSNDLNPHVLNNYGLISALKLFVDKISKEVRILFEENLGDVRYSTAIELSLYRISKELINNTIKHANATEIKLHIWEKGSTLNLVYEDNGKGLPDGALKVKKPGGMGLSNIISRAKSLNAKHTFHTNLPVGFKFELQVPLVQE